MTNNSLGYHRKMSAVIFGEDSPATKYLDKKIAEAPNGENEEVIVPESQLITALMCMHNGEEDSSWETVTQ